MLCILELLLDFTGLFGLISCVANINSSRSIPFCLRTPYLEDLSDSSYGPYNRLLLCVATDSIWLTVAKFLRDYSSPPVYGVCLSMHFVPLPIGV